MYWLREYRRKPIKLTDYLPWLCMFRPGVVVNKDGSFQKTFRFRGPDLDSATEPELLGICARINNVFKRFPGGWAIFSDAIRFRSEAYPNSAFPDPVSYLIDLERKKYFDAGNHFESAYYLTIQYLPPAEKTERLSTILIKRDDSGMLREGYRAQLQTFITECDRVFKLLRETWPEMEELDSDETMTYLHWCTSTKRHYVKTPPSNMDLDIVLGDKPLLGGLEPKLGEKHLRIVSVLSFPGNKCSRHIG